MAKTETVKPAVVADSKYEPAPADDINKTAKGGAAAAPATVVTDAKKLSNLEKECADLQKSIQAIKNDRGAADSQWVKAGTDKPASTGAVSMIQLILAFIICVFLGMYLNKGPAVTEQAQPKVEV